MRAARIAADKGYTKVYAFVGGIPEWHAFNYPMTINKEWQAIKVNKLGPEEFNELLNKPDIYILDVRPFDFTRDTSFITNSHHCPLVFLAHKYKEIPIDMGIIITDWAMKQSVTAAKFLTKNNYKVIGVLKGGMERWKLEKFPVEHREPSYKIDNLDISGEE